MTRFCLKRPGRSGNQRLFILALEVRYADQRPLSIAAVIQKAFIGVDEDGTEAAAATAVTWVGDIKPPSPVPFTVDRPFLFYIQDKTGLVLFTGQVVDPTAT